MKCPYCGNEDSAVKDSRPSEDHSAIRRRRSCTKCGERFTTYERIQLRDFYVVKRNGERSDFDREKLERSVRVALRKRPIPNEKVDQMIQRVIGRIEGSNQEEITSKNIGETVMAELAILDPVAYIRFASVYRDFQGANDFEDFLHKLRPKPDEL